LPDHSSDIKARFESIGGLFLLSTSEFEAKVKALRCFLFDWDGVFNSGVKTAEGGSPFSEVDSMGINMLRFSYYLKFSFIPDVHIITGENNPAALHLATRERFQGVYLKAKDKTQALKHLVDKFSVPENATAFTYDDILDLGLAKQVGVRFLVNRAGNPMLSEYIERNSLADYKTANSGNNNSVREMCELCIAILGNYDETIALRMANDIKYKEYLELRNQGQTAYFKFESGSLVEFSYP